MPLHAAISVVQGVIGDVVVYKRSQRLEAAHALPPACSQVAEMEEKLPKDSEGSTLWECEELALRYLLEDGKMNLCLRLMDQPVLSLRAC